MVSGPALKTACASSMRGAIGGNQVRPFLQQKWQKFTNPAASRISKAPRSCQLPEAMCSGGSVRGFEQEEEATMAEGDGRNGKMMDLCETVLCCAGAVTVLGW